MATKYEQYMAGEITEDEFLSGSTTTTDDLDRPDFFEVFQQSLDQLQATGYAGVRVLGETFGNEALQRIGTEGVIRNEQSAARYGRPMTIEDIEGPGDVADWLFTNAIPQVIPSIAASLPLAIVGGFAGGALLPAALGTAATRTAIGGGLGAFLPSAFLGAGEVDREMKSRLDDGFQDPLAALGGGAIIGALDTAALAFGLKGVIPQLAKKIGVGDKFGLQAFNDTVNSLVERGVTPNVAGRAVAQGLAAAVAEGSTEATQEFLTDRIAEANTGVSSDEQELASTLMNSFALGAVGGSPIGLVAGGLRARSLKENVEAQRQYNQKVEEVEAEVEQFARDEELENLSEQDLRAFANREFPNQKDWSNLSKEELITELKNSRKSAAMTEYARDLIEQQIGTEQSRTALERKEYKDIINELDGAEIIQQAEKLFGKTYTAKTGGVKQAAQDLAQERVRNQYISNGQSKLLMAPGSFSRYIKMLETEKPDDFILRLAEDLFPNKYDSTSAPAALQKNRAALIKEIAEKKYNIEQNQEQLTLNEKNTPILIEVGPLGNQQGAASEQINTRNPEKSLVQEFVVAINEENFTFVKEKIESDAGDVVGFQYVDKSSGKSYEQIQNEQGGRPVPDFIAGEVEAEGNPTVFKSYSVFRGDMPMQQNGVLGSLKNIWKYLFFADNGLGQTVFELDRQRIGRQRGLNKIAQQAAEAYERAADTAVLEGSVKDRAEIDQLVSDFLTKAYEPKPLNEEQRIAKRGEIADLQEKSAGTIDEIKKGQFAKAIESLERELEEGARIDAVTLEDLPENVRNVAAQMRTTIDSLSTRILDEFPATVLDEKTKVDRGGKKITELKKNIIEAQLGAYLTRSYKLFDPSYGWNPSSFFGKLNKEQQKAFNVAVEYQMKDKSMSREQATTSVNSIIKNSLAAETIDPSLIQTITGRQVNEGKISPLTQFLKQREKLPEELRGLFGEITNPSQLVATTVNRLTSYVENFNFYQKLLDEDSKPGKKIFATSPTEELDTEVPLQNSPIDGLFTTKELAKALALNKEDKSSLLKFYDSFFLIPKAIVQSFKTVYSITAQTRNAITASMFYLGNGHLNTSDFSEAMRTIYYELSGTGFDSSGQKLSPRIHREKIYKLMQDLGIVNTSVRLQDVIAVFNEAGSGGYRTLNDFQAFLNSKHIPVVNKFVKGVTKIAKKPADIYQASDDFFKIASFFSEKRKLAKAYDNSEASMQSLENFAKSLGNLKVENLSHEDMLNHIAAYKVRHTIPNYDYVGNFVKGLRRTPLGNFVAFPTEIIRTSFNMFWLAGKEISSGNEQQMIQGYRRLLSGGTMALGLPLMAFAYGKAESGIDDEDLEAARRILPEYAKNNFIIPVSKRSAEEGGGFNFIDGSHLFVYDTVARIPFTVFNAIREGEDIGRGTPSSVAAGMFDAITDLTSAYLTPSIAPQVTLDLYNNRKESGGAIRIEGDTWGNQAKDMFNYAFEKAQPGFIQQLGRVMQGGEMGEFAFDKYGNRQEFDDAILGLMGLKVSKVNPTQSLPFLISDFKKADANSKRLFTRITYQSGAVSAQDILNAYSNSQRASYTAQQNFYKDYLALQRLGVNKRELRKQIKQRIGDRKIRANIMRGVFTPYKPPKSARRNFELATKRMLNAGALVSPDRYYPNREIIDLLNFYRRNRLNLSLEFFTPDDI